MNEKRWKGEGKREEQGEETKNMENVKGETKKTRIAKIY